MTETMWTCCDSEVYDTPGIKEHLAEVHGITSTKLQVTNTMHLDFDDGSTLNSYVCEVEGVTVCKTVKFTPESESES